VKEMKKEKTAQGSVGHCGELYWPAPFQKQNRVQKQPARGSVPKPFAVFSFFISTDAGFYPKNRSDISPNGFERGWLERGLLERRFESKNRRQLTGIRFAASHRQSEVSLLKNLDLILLAP
jgi:hypothetical protein